MSSPAVFSSPSAVFAVAGADEPTVTELRDALLAEFSLDSVIAILARSGITAMPDFVCAAPDGSSMRVLTRGTLSVHVTRVDGTTEHIAAATNAATWREEIVERVATLRVQHAETRLLEWMSGAASQPIPSSSVPERSAPAAPSDTSPASTDDASPARQPEPRSADDAASPTNPDPEPSMPEPSAPEEASSPPSSAPVSSVVSSTEHVPTSEPPAADVTRIGPVSASPPAPEPAEHQPTSADVTRIEPLDLTVSPPGVPAATSPATAPDATTVAPHDDGATTVISTIPATHDVEEVEEVEEAMVAGADSSGIAPSPPADAPAETDSANGAAPSLVDESTSGDHDGLTVVVGRATELAAEVDAAATRSAVPTVEARHCPAGHPNPVEAERCRVCGAALTGEVTTIHRPSVARLVFDSGMIVEVDRPQVVGRRPSLPDDAERSDLPGLIAVPDPHQDLSRSHLSIELEGWVLLASDLDSTNGTTVTHPGQSPVRLRPHEPTALVDGSQLALGDVASITIEAPSW
ncbi:MAG: FHA domain-containing protein [Actinomycetota bacterium]